MIPLARLSQEDERLALLHATRLLELDTAPAFDALTRLSSAVMACPLASINLVDAERVWSLSSQGLTVRQVLRTESLCDITVRSQAPLLVNDMRADPQHVQRPYVAGPPHIRAYAGVPVLVDGRALGTVCVLDVRPREWSEQDLAHLQDLSASVSALVEAQLRAQRERVMAARFRTCSLAGSDWLWETDHTGQISWVSDSLRQHTGLAPDQDMGRRHEDIYQLRDGANQDAWKAMQAAFDIHAPFSEAIAERLTPRGWMSVSISGTPVFDSKGQFKGYRGASRNVTRQLANEQEAKRADVLLRRAIESFHVGVMISQADGQVVMHNSEWLRHMGNAFDPSKPSWPDTIRRLHRQGAYGEPALSEDDFLAWRLNLHQQTSPSELPFNGGWLLVKDQLLPDGCTVHFAMDISRQKHDAKLLVEKQKALQETDEWLSAVLRALPDLWLVFDADGRYVDAHTEHPFLMRPFDELKGKLIEETIPEQQAAKQRAAMRQAQISRLPQRLDYSLVTQDGAVRHFEARMTPMPQGQTLLLTRDMTDRQLAAEQLRVSEERWKFALDGAGDWVWDWDVSSQKIFFSPQWKQLLGYADRELPNELHEMLARIHPEDKARVEEDFTRYLHSAKGVYQSEFRMLHKQGHQVWILSRGKVVSEDAQGRPLRLVGTHSDITLLKQAESALRAKQSAEAASLAKSEFLSRMSHEIRTPLNAVKGFAQLLQLQMTQTTSPPAQINYVAQIRHASEHLMGLVNDVLDLQQVETGLLSFVMENLCLNDELKQCVDMLTPLASSRSISLHPALSHTWRVQADKQRLRQVLMNIGSNAIKYNRDGGCVRFEVGAAASGSLNLVITDSGSGMSAEQLARLFQPFERLGHETSTIEGTGLGLIITRSLVEAMGGTLTIHSQPGQGTRVVVNLPQGASVPKADNGEVFNVPEFSSPSPQSMHMVTSAPTETASSALRVLYVEDNRINAMLFEEALRPYEQIELDVAEDGQMALSLARERHPQVLVLDAHLPGMSGFDVLKALRKVPGLENVPAYMCSADAMPEDVSRALAEGFTGYWTKPIDIVAVTTELCSLAAAAQAPTP